MPKQCPQCGATLPSGGLEGLCPACLLKQGVETGPPAGSVPFQPPSLEEVARLFPQLQILAFIGKGGMGAVYQARQPALDRLVALKILPPQAAGGPGFAERFNREARALARLSHPNIVAVHEFGQAGGSPFFIMEFVDGLTLRQLEQAGRLSPAEALRIVPQICEALQFAHDEGIVHRDIKPENILIDKKGRVKIADFGIAKIIGGEEAGAGMTGTRQAIGTPHYMAPEQVEKPQTVDHRADIFSLGVVFYEMLTGQLPLGRFAPPSRKVEIDARLDEVVLRALEREPELRYQQAGEVKTQIDTIASTPPANLSGEHMRPRMSQSAPAPAGPLQPHRQIFAWLALGFLIAGLLGCPLLIAIRADENGVGAFTGLSLALALIFGLISWRERSGYKIAMAILAMVALFGVVVVPFVLYRAARSRSEAQAAQQEQAVRMAELQRVQAEKKQMADHEQWLNTPVGERAKAAAEAKAKEAAERLGNKPIVDAHNNLLAQGGVGDAKPTEAIAVRGSIRRYQDCIGSVESSNSVVFYIPAPAAEEVIKKLGGGNPLPVEVFVQDTNKLGHGILLAVDRQVDPTTGTVKCKASLQPEPDRVVLINQYVSVRLLLEMKHDVVIVPATALIHDIPDRVLVINPDRSFSVREVVVGITDGTNAEIQSGLQLGETVVGNNAGMLEETRHTTSANPGPPVSFTVIPLTNGWLSYQWQLDGTNLRYQWFDNATNITVRTNQDGTLLLINSGSNSTAKTNP